jgi:hypothetical protein
MMEKHAAGRVINNNCRLERRENKREMDGAISALGG